MANSGFARWRWELTMVAIGVVGELVAWLVRTGHVIFPFSWLQEVTHNQLADLTDVVLASVVFMAMGMMIWAVSRRFRVAAEWSRLGSGRWRLVAPAAALAGSLFNEAYQGFAHHALFGLPWFGSVYDRGDVMAILLGGAVAFALTIKAVQARANAALSRPISRSRAAGFAVLMTAVFLLTGAASSSGYGPKAGGKGTDSGLTVHCIAEDPIVSCGQGQWIKTGHVKGSNGKLIPVWTRKTHM